MKLLLWTDDLMTRTRLASRWQAAGAELLRRDGDDIPDLVVLDLTAADALSHLAQIQVRWPHAEVVAFGPHVDADVFRQAKAAGATTLVPRGKVLERVLARL
ncbi:MAG: hypothetical protein WCC36_07755 [Gammaproteobacteria bacterium]